MIRMLFEHFMTPYCNNVAHKSIKNFKISQKPRTFLINTRRTSALSNPCDEIPIPPSDSGFTDSLWRVTGCSCTSNYNKLFITIDWYWIIVNPFQISALIICCIVWWWWCAWIRIRFIVVRFIFVSHYIWLCVLW